VSEAGAAEVSRKSVHVILGLLCLGFPWWFDGPGPVWMIAAVATLVLMCLRWIPALRQGIGASLHGVKRFSYGDMLFGPAVATVFHLSDGDPFLFCIPVGILTLADAAGALGGTRWGKHLYGSGEGFKSIEGSTAFFLTAAACVFLPLWLGGATGLWIAIWVGLILGLLAMMSEGLADRGFDNIVIPVGCYFVLARLIELDAVSLVWRFGVVVFFLALVLTGARWSTLSGGALLGCALLGYGCAVMADFRFILPPLGVFFCHVFVTRKNHLVGVFDHRLDAVLSHAIGCMPWVIAVERGVLDADVGLAGVSFAMATQLGILDMATHWWVHEKPAPLLRSLVKGWGFCALPGLIWLWPGSIPLAIAAGLAVISTGCGIWIFRRIKPQEFRHPTRLWVLKGVVALLSSSPALFLLQ